MSEENKEDNSSSEANTEHNQDNQKKFTETSPELTAIPMNSDVSNELSQNATLPASIPFVTAGSAHSDNNDENNDHNIAPTDATLPSASALPKATFDLGDKASQTPSTASDDETLSTPQTTTSDDVSNNPEKEETEPASLQAGLAHLENQADSDSSDDSFFDNQPVMGFTMLENVQSIHDNIEKKLSATEGTDLDVGTHEIYDPNNNPEPVSSVQPFFTLAGALNNPKEEEEAETQEAEESLSSLPAIETPAADDILRPLPAMESPQENVKPLPAIEPPTESPSAPSHKDSLKDSPKDSPQINPQDNLSDQLSQHSQMMKELLTSNNKAGGGGESKITAESFNAAFTINESIIGNPLAKGNDETHAHSKKSTPFGMSSNNPFGTAGGGGTFGDNPQPEKDVKKSPDNNTDIANELVGASFASNSILAIQQDDGKDADTFNKHIAGPNDDHDDTLLNNLDLPPPEADGADATNTENNLVDNARGVDKDTAMEEMWDASAPEVSQGAFQDKSSASASEGSKKSSNQHIEVFKKYFQENTSQVTKILVVAAIAGGLIFFVGIDKLKDFTTDFTKDFIDGFTGQLSTGDEVSNSDDYEDDYDGGDSSDDDSDDDSDVANNETQDSDTTDDTPYNAAQSQDYTEDTSSLPYWNVEIPKNTTTVTVVTLEDISETIEEIQKTKEEALWTKEELEKKLTSDVIWHNYEAVHHIRKHRLWNHAALLKSVIEKNRKLWLSLEAYAALLESNISSSLDITDLKSLVAKHRSDLLKRWSKRFRSKKAATGDEKLLGFLLRISPPEVRYEILRTFVSIRTELAKNHIAAGTKDPNNRIANACTQWSKT
ncbi:MAG: hypothetical protein OXC44_03085 [Proteobacteria bacterium]|nr:hypothetical protein [Pseudomonadota bacterium]